jgi:hypothetical protein
LKYLLLSFMSLLAQASTVTFYPAPGEGPAVPVTVTITDIAGGVWLQTTVTGNPIGDIQGIFFSLSGGLPTCSEISGWTGCQVAEGAVSNLGQGLTMEGTGQLFDVGLRIGSPGIGEDDIQSVTNVVISGGIHSSQFTAIGVRLTSVGDAGGLRTDSAKLISFQDIQPPTEVPEPFTFALIGLGLATLGSIRKTV